MYKLRKDVILEVAIKSYLFLIYWLERFIIMICENCGAKIKRDTEICPNCGAVVKGFVLSSTDYGAINYRRDVEEARRKKGPFSNPVVRGIIVFILVLAIGCGSYFYFDYKHNTKPAPELSFNSGTGIINDERIVYLTFKDAYSVEFIHGVKLYNGDVTKPSLKQADPISTDYEYTKDISDAFRSIFFYADEIGVKKGQDYTFTFEMELSFVSDSNFYTYQEVVNINGDINKDASEIIFDHSMDEKLPFDENTITTRPAESTTQQETTSSTTADYSFVYSGFWFTEPYHDADSYSIAAWKFNTNKTVDVTSYSKSGNDDWQVVNYTFPYEDNGEYLLVKDGDNGETSTIKLDADKSSVSQYDDEDSTDVMTFTNRKYNSIKNVEDFFGI